MSATLTEELVDGLMTFRLSDLSATTRKQAMNCLIDGVGCGMYGAQQPWSQILLAQLAREQGLGEAIVLGQAARLPAAAAALCNGTAIHGFELDDLIARNVMHPAAAVIPAALAAAEAVDADGATLLRAIVAGYEAMNRVASAVGRAPVDRGFHATSLIGPMGAAFAAGIVYRLDKAQMLSAIGIAASEASGIKSFADGHGGGMVKRLHMGRAAEGGVRAAQLAAAGFSGPPQALESRFGFFNVYGGDRANAQLLVEGLGRLWAVDDVWFKVYPICGWIQAVVQLVTELRGSTPIDPNRVGRVRVGVSAYAARNNDALAPEDVMGAQYSIPYCVAGALTGDLRDPAMFDEKLIVSPAMRALAAKVELYVDPEMEAAYPQKLGARVELIMASGEKSEALTLDCKGTPADPVSHEQHLEKFRILSKDRISAHQAAQFLEMAGDLENLGAVRAMMAALVPVGHKEN